MVAVRKVATVSPPVIISVDVWAVSSSQSISLDSTLPMRFAVKSLRAEDEPMRLARMVN